MNPKDFSTNAPGRLVPTTFWVPRQRDGRWESAQTPGEAFVPNPLPPKLDWDRVLGRLRRPLLEATAVLSRLDGKASKLSNPYIIIRPFQRREARVSSLIEDTVATPEELALVAAGATVPGEGPREVHNYVLALEQGLASRLPISNRLIRDLHRTLVQGVRGDRDLPGEFRREQNYIGSADAGPRIARFVPPPHGETLESCMAAYEQFVNRCPEELPGLVAIALSHYQFECIHPFRDGNGRLGRLLIVLELCRNEHLARPLVYVSEYFHRHEREYKDLLLRVSTLGEWEAWIGFVLRGFAEQGRIADRVIDRLTSLRDDMVQAVARKRVSALRTRLIEHLFATPAVTIQSVTKLLGVTDTAARRHVDALIHAKFLFASRDAGRSTWYIARPIIEAGDPVQDDAEPG